MKNPKKKKAKARKWTDFSGGVKGKYAAKFAEGSNIVLLDEDVARWFPDSEAVNRALRALAEVASRENLKKAQ